MTALQLLTHLRTLGVRLQADGDRLRFTAPPGTLTPDLMAELSRHKSDLLDFLRKAEAAAEAAAPMRVPIRREGDLPLSFGQQRLWFFDKLHPGTFAYNIPAAFRLRGRLDVPVLEQCFSELVRRHEALRTTFKNGRGEPSQHIVPPVPVRIPVVDLQHQAAETREAKAERLALEEARVPFDLNSGLLVRATLLRLAPDEHILLVTMHHVASDGWSIGILTRELSALYQAFVEGKPSPLPELVLQYADVALWQQEGFRNGSYTRQIEYWKTQLGGELPLLELPTDRPRPAVQRFYGANRSLVLPKALVEGLKALAHREEGSLFMVLLAAFKTLLHRYTGQEDLLVGTPIANRNRREVEDLIGFFINTLVLRTDVTGDPSFRDLLQRVKDVSLAAFANQDAPFEKLVEALKPERNLSHSPFFQVMFVHQNAPMTPLTLPGVVPSPVTFYGGTAKFELTLYVEETGNGLLCTVEYNTDLFEAETIDRLLGHYRTLLEGVTARPDRPLSRLPLLTEAETRRMLGDWNARTAPIPDACIHEQFEAQAARTPEAVAVVYGNEHLTYRALNRRANQVAHVLRGYGVGPGVRVAICMERSLDMVVGLLGILKAGGAYVPVDPAYPEGRLTFMLEDSQARVVLTQSRLAEGLPDGPAPILSLDAGWSTFAQAPTGNPASGVTPDDLIYVIYTSGSTGRPKGAGVYHRGFTNLVDWFITDFEMTGRDRVLLMSSFSFDLTQKDIYAPLLVGGQLHALAAENFDVKAIHRAIESERITLVNCTPSAFYPVVDAAEATGFGGLASLRYVFLGGEPISVRRLWKWLDSGHGRAQVVNTYGPTECTDVSAFYRIERPGDWLDAPVPVGKPVPNVELYVLDRPHGLCPVGVTGELCVGGAGVGAGYLNDEARTADRFIAHPFRQEAGARIFRTGDLARYLPDGNIEFQGRMDHQVKIRGFRIELGEIEAVLAEHAAVQEAVVTAHKDPQGFQRLVAYLVQQAGETAADGELRAYLKAHLPEYMVPAAFVTLDALPLSPNGKVDRRRLPDPDLQATRPARDYTPPRTETEQTISKVWQELLHVDRVGLHDNFFDLGGHSLLLAQMQTRLSEVLGREIPIVTLFRHTTVSALARCAWPESSGVEAPAVAPTIDRVRQRAAQQQAALARRQQARRGWRVDQNES